jgi:hypothetical protein
MSENTSPAVVPRSVIAVIHSYREAVRVAWRMRSIWGMTKQLLAAEAGLYASHVTDYLHEDDKPSRRDLPASRIEDFERAVGNRVVSQWLAMRAEFTVLEEIQADRERPVA